MTMQTDVLASKPLTATGNFKAQNNGDIPRTRIKAIYAVNSANAGSVVIREGGATGNIIATINTAPNVAGYTIIPVPGQGVLCKEGNLHGTVADVASVTVFYG